MSRKKPGPRSEFCKNPKGEVHVVTIDGTGSAPAGVVGVVGGFLGMVAVVEVGNVAVSGTAFMLGVVNTTATGYEPAMARIASMIACEPSF